MSEKLKPCPFCGGEAVLIKKSYTFSGALDFHIACKSCPVQTKTFCNCEFCDVDECVRRNCPEEAENEVKIFLTNVWNKRR